MVVNKNVTPVTINYDTSNLKCLKMYCVNQPDNVTSIMNKLMSDFLARPEVIDKVEKAIENQRRRIEERKKN